MSFFVAPAMIDWNGLAVFVAAAGSTASLLLTTVNGILSKRRADRNAEALTHVVTTVAAVKEDVGAVKTDMNELKVNTNHKMDQLLEVTGTAKFAEGAKSEVDKAAAVAAGQPA